MKYSPYSTGPARMLLQMFPVPGAAKLTVFERNTGSISGLRATATNRSWGSVLRILLVLPSISGLDTADTPRSRSCLLARTGSAHSTSVVSAAHSCRLHSQYFGRQCYWHCSECLQLAVRNTSNSRRILESMKHTGGSCAFCPHGVPFSTR